MLTISEALNLPTRAVVAFVGGGGKTTAIFRLARELVAAGRNVVVTTTTHFAHEQVALADRHLTLTTHRTRFALGPGGGLILVTGAVDVSASRVPGITPAKVLILRDARGVDVVLVEADGARLRPFKAPAAHEPVIPSCATHVVAVVGADVFGQPLAEPHVHRPERMAALAGVALGRPLTPALVAGVLTHRQGGAKALPARARFSVLINKVEGDERRAQAAQCAALLLGAARVEDAARVEGVLLGALAHSAAVEQWQRVAVVVLAAGQGQRLGDAVKPLLVWQRSTLLARALRAAGASHAAHVAVVLGHAARQVRAALPAGRVQVVDNPDWAAGQSTSVQAAIRALPANIGAVLFMLVDQPFVEADVLDALIARWHTTGAPMVAPRVDGRRANPVLFARRVWPDLLAVSGDSGGRPLFERYAGQVGWVDWPDDITPDIDTFEDYARLAGHGE